MADEVNRKNKKLSFGRLIIRFLIISIVLIVTAFFTPGFALAGITTALIESAVIVGLDYLIEAVTGFDASPFGRGLSGFIVSALIIYATRYIVPGVSVTLIGALIAALVVGIIEAILPVNVF